MKSLLLLACLTLISCGKEIKDSRPKPVPQPPEPQATSVLNLWVNDNQASVLKTLDLRSLNVGQLQNASTIGIICDGSLGNSGSIDDVPEEMIGSIGNEENGVIQVGHLSYVGASDLACRAMSKERYTYSIVGQTLILQNVGYCASKPCANDGVEVFQLGE